MEGLNPSAPRSVRTSPIRDIDITVIGDRACGTTRAYLWHLRATGLRPRRLWLVDFHPAPASARRLRRLPVLGAWLANRAHARQPVPGYTPPPPFEELCRELQTCVVDGVDFTGAFDFHAFAAQTRELNAEDYSDPYLQALILRHRGGAFLYTSGGLVPRTLLRKPGVRILHVHPGVVPQMRGSDCLLWSCQVRGRPGASCFYMAPGIDDGPLIDTMEFSLPDLGCLEPYLDATHEDTVYRALAIALDPHMRAAVLCQVLKQAGEDDLRELPARPQPADPTLPYLWMHPQVRLKVLKDIVARSKACPGQRLEPMRP